MTQPLHYAESDVRSTTSPGALTTTAADPTVGATAPPRQSGPSSATTTAVVGGASFEALAGLGAVVLAILALIDIAAANMVAIATIAAGAGLLLRGATIASRSQRLIARLSGPTDEAALSGGLGVEMIAGLGAITLGILALFDVNRSTLPAVAVIGLGGALLLGAGSTRSLDIALRGYDNDSAQTLAQSGASGELLIGIGATTLGILALFDIGQEKTLVAAGLIAVGAGLAVEATPALARIFGGR